LRAVLDLSRQRHPVLLLQPLDNLEVSIPTSNVDGQPAHLGRSHQRHPVLLRQPLDQLEVSITTCPVYGLRALLGLSSERHPVLHRQPLDELEVSISTCAVYGLQVARTEFAVNDTPSCAANHLTISRCPLTHAQCMGSHVFTTILIGLFCLVNREECMGNDSLYPRAHSPPGVHAPRT
jgi:hypothetical protein